MPKKEKLHKQTTEHHIQKYNSDFNEAVSHLQQGGVIAYPTEAVYGLGCDPMNADAVTRILQLKNRPIEKGFILIGSQWDQFISYVEPIEPQALARVFASWPGPVTWVFPANPRVPMWVRGKFNTIAIRVTDHPIAKELCERFGTPIISTSANLNGHPPIRSEKMIQMTFGNKIDMIMPGELGSDIRPTEIRDAISGEIIRAK